MDKGKDFLHNHPEDEKRLKLDKDHVIVNRDAWEEARKIWEEERELIAKIEEWEPEIRKVLDSSEPKKRYFIVFYKIFGSSDVISHCDVSTDGEYVDGKEISEKVLKEFNKRFDGQHVFQSLSITNIIELNESDYKDWVK